MAKLITFIDETGTFKILLKDLSKYLKMSSSDIIRKAIFDFAGEYDKINIDEKIKQDWFEKMRMRKSLMERKKLKNTSFEIYEVRNKWVRFVDMLLKGMSEKSLKMYLEKVMVYAETLHPDVLKSEKENWKKLKYMNNKKRIKDIHQKVKDLIERNYNVVGLANDLSYGYPIFVKRYQYAIKEFDKKTGLLIEHKKGDGNG